LVRLAVLNPGGNDRFQTFPDFAGEPTPALHPPVNYHGFAACTGGAFHRSVRTIARDERAVLLLIRRDLRATSKALDALRARGKTVLVAVKEAGLLQISQLLDRAGNLALFERICNRAHGCIATTQPLCTLLRTVTSKPVEFIPTPYPMEDPRWNFACSPEERRGIFIGTREFDVASRNHLSALLSARSLPESLGERITVINTNGRAGRKLLGTLRFKSDRIHIVDGRMNYPAYLKFMAGHKLVFQLDRSHVPGQVAGDALLCRIPCVGGNGATERIIFPFLCGHGRDTEQLVEIVKYLMSDSDRREHFIEQAQSRACDQLTFQAVAEKLRLFLRHV
jgi:hypothetical protein